MEPILLENHTESGQGLQALFTPDKGMNMISFKKGDIEVIDQSTFPFFEERFAGLGALIGPHFHRRRAASVPNIKDEHLFPHIARVRAKGSADPFSHGIARYAPWKADYTREKVKATLSGKDLWNDTPLSALEGQNFKMELMAELKPNGLFLQLSIVSDTDSLIGIHYYYSLSNNKGRILADVRDQMRNQKGELISVPPEWLSANHQLSFDLSQEADFTFRPFINPLKTTITLETEAYSLKTHYSCMCEENAWQLYHPAHSSFVCIEPVSSQDPRHPNLSVSSLSIHLEIL